MSAERPTNKQMLEALRQLRGEITGNDGNVEVTVRQIKTMKDLEDVPPEIRDALLEAIANADLDEPTESEIIMGKIKDMLDATHVTMDIALELVTAQNNVLMLERKVTRTRAEVLEELLANASAPGKGGLGSNETERKIRMEKVLAVDHRVTKLEDELDAARCKLNEMQAASKALGDLETVLWRVIRAHLKDRELRIMEYSLGEEEPDDADNDMLKA